MAEQATDPLTEEGAVFPHWSLKGVKCNCKVTGVYDGDTITIALPVGDKYYRFKTRLEGINTPEIRTRDIDEKLEGLETRDWLRTQILDEIVWVECGAFDKYGRLLATIYREEGAEMSVNTELITTKRAVEYHGGTKPKWVSKLKI